jgi:hypothetical protein
MTPDVRKQKIEEYASAHDQLVIALKGIPGP